MSIITNFRKVFYLFLLPSIGFSQDTAHDITLIDVNYSVEGVLFDRLDPTYTNTHTKLFNKLFTTTSLDSLDKYLNDVQGMELRTIDTLKEYITHNSIGLPNSLSAKAAIKKVTKKGYQEQQFLQLSLRLGIEGDVIGQSRLLKRIKPKLEVVLTLFDNQGAVLQKRIARSIFPKFIDSEAFGEMGFSKKNRQHTIQLELLLQPLIGKTINNAVKKIK